VEWFQAESAAPRWGPCRSGQPTGSPIPAEANNRWNQGRRARSSSCSVGEVNRRAHRSTFGRSRLQPGSACSASKTASRHGARGCRPPAVEIQSIASHDPEGLPASQLAPADCACPQPSRVVSKVGAGNGVEIRLAAGNSPDHQQAGSFSRGRRRSGGPLLQVHQAWKGCTARFSINRWRRASDQGTGGPHGAPAPAPRPPRPSPGCSSRAPVAPPMELVPSVAVIGRGRAWRSPRIGRP